MSQQAIAVVNKMAPDFKRALPSHVDYNRFTRIALTAIRKNPKLAECSQESLLGSLMLFAQLGLEPNTPLGQAYLVPFRSKGNMEVTPIIGYKGMIDLGYRTGNYETLDAHAVYAKDHFVYEYGFDEKLEHRRYQPAEDEDYTQGTPTHYYAYYKLKNGGRRFRVWTRQQCIAHGKKYSKSFNFGPWKNNTDSMCLKTVIKDLMTLAPMSPEDKNNWAMVQGDNQNIRIDSENAIEIEFNKTEEVEAENKEAEAVVTKEDEDLKEMGL